MTSSSSSNTWITPHCYTLQSYVPLSWWVLSCSGEHYLSFLNKTQMVKIEDSRRVFIPLKKRRIDVCDDAPHPPTRRWDFCIPSTRNIIIILTFNHSFLHNRPAEKSVHLFGQSGEAAASSEILIDNIETVGMRALTLGRAILPARERKNFVNARTVDVEIR